MDKFRIYRPVTLKPHEAMVCALAEIVSGIIGIITLGHLFTGWPLEVTTYFLRKRHKRGL